MPQPFSRIGPRVSGYTIGIHAMSKRPELAAKLAAVIASWSEVEVRMATAMCEAMQASAEPFAAAFQALNSTAAQASVADAAIRVAVDPSLLPAFDAIMSLFRSAKKIRDRIAHGTWGYCDALPDALLWIDPKLIVMRESMFVQNSRMSPDGLTRLSDCGGKHVIGHDEVMVYTASDFDGAFERNKRIAFFFIQFGWCVWPESGADGSKLRQLQSEPEIADIMARRK
jgi:hypothetical protein